MTNLTAVAGWDNVPQLEVDTLALGGVGSPMNTQAQALLNRMAFLQGAGGAAKIGAADAGGFFAGADLEAITQEVAARLQAIDTFNAALSAASRSSPHANFSIFTADFKVIGCQGVGRAFLKQDLGDVFFLKYGGSMSGVSKFVAPYGNDTTGTGDSWTSPYRTIDKALRTSTCGKIYLWPGQYEMPSFRYNDTAGGQPKALIAPFRNVTISTTGVATTGAGPISDAGCTWTADGTYPNTYYTTIASASPQPVPVRLLMGGTVDKYGRAVPIPKYSSVATADASGYGWWYDAATRRLYVRKATENINTLTKSSLTAVYANGGDNSLLLLSAKLYMDGITLHGYASILKQSGQAVPELWIKNCEFMYGDGSSRAVMGGRCYSQGGFYYRSASDHANYTNFDGTTAFGLEANDLTAFAGDVGTFGVGASQPNNPISTSQNKNGSSCHDGVVVRINGMHDEVYGPPIADTTGSTSWCIGTRTGYSYADAGGSQRIGILIQGGNAWLDSCAGGDGQDYAFNAAAAGVVRTFNCLGDKLTSGGGSFSAFTPD